jgi:hypothetical protein
MNLKTAIDPRKTRKARNKPIGCLEAVIHPLGNDLRRCISLYISRAYALQRNTRLPYFVIFVDKLFFLE